MKKKKIIIVAACILFALIAAAVIIPATRNKNEANETPSREDASEKITSNAADGEPSESALSNATESPSESGLSGNTHIVTFLDGDGEIITTQSVNDGENAAPPKAPDREGYFFLKWDKSLVNIRSDIDIRALYLATKNPTFAIDNVYVDPSQKTVKVDIRCINNPGLASAFLSLSYDSILSLESVEFNSEFGQYTTTPIPYGNPQTISMISPFSDINYSGVFATLTFSITNAQDIGKDYRAAIRISYDADNTFNSDYEDVWFDVIDGSVNIIG